MLENLYGKVSIETRFVSEALKSASTRETAHPDDRRLWTPDNPTYGHCDLYTDFVRRIWGKDERDHWNSEAHILVWWVYPDYDAFLAGVKKNKLTVHYSFETPKYGEIDLSREQFPEGTYLYPRPKPLTHVVPVGKSWDRSSEMGIRKELFERVFIESLFNNPLPSKTTPEFNRFVSNLG